ALLFVASLHHMPLPETLQHAAGQLVPEGLLVADEFDLDAADEPTARFWQELTGKDGPPLKAWRHHHAHHGVLATGAQMLHAVQNAGFRIRETQRVPYLYRYLPDDADAQPAFEEEQRRIAAGALQAVGLRFIASR